MNPVRLALGAGTVLVLSALMSVHFLPDRVSVRLGEPAPSEIRASRSVSYVDTDATARRRSYYAARVTSVYDPDPGTLQQAVHSSAQVFETVRRARSGASPAAVSRKADRLSQELGSVLTAGQVRYLLLSPPATLERLQTTSDRLVRDEMAREIRSNTGDLAHAIAGLADGAQRALTDANELGIVQAVGSQALRPNLLYNARRTQAQRDAAMRYVPDVTGHVRLGDLIVHQGEPITQLHLDQLAALGLITPRLALTTVLSIVAMAAGMVFLVAYHLRRACPTLYASPRHLILLAAVASLGVFGLKLFGALLGVPLTYVQFGYLGMATVVAAGMLITVLFNGPLAILITALLAVQSGLMMNHEIRFAAMYFVSGLVGIYSVGNIRNRTHLMRAALTVSAVNVSLVWILGGLLGDSLPEILTGSVWATGAGALATTVLWFCVALLEKPFGILTHVWLLELSASEHPLLRELCVRAPGTYAHSIMVGNLAEAAAEAIGADTLLCRVGAYYHDVGKVRMPHCFIENQRADNIHNRLAPSLSALVVSSHVRDGIELADKFRLPQEIKDIIAQHHGTTLIRYFYSQAVAGCIGAADPLLEQHFRYDGPRPQSRESGIIMLADTVEAAARCLDKPSPARMQGLVESLVRDKLADGQLDDCDLTFKDLQRIQAAFVRVLSAMLHGRIDYPELPRAGSLAELTADSRILVADERLVAQLAEQTGEEIPLAARRPGSAPERGDPTG